ncbi:hypothetical protein [Kordiimonas laminariae]|uniref:hypothetical protein n=1 Tax=Kordiimonas laminariae TaxID=2917717 RepID=UPI001FF18F87|nr:hypothetical protein [Kordiimonas laminariae]MCK0067960.1 hypothetical protein [Kordiimonas laminariae]
MNDSVLETLCKKLSSTKVLIVMGILSAATMFLVFPNLPYNGVKTLDARFSYDAITVMQVLDGLGADGREFYKWGSSFIDMAYPFIYGSFFVGLIYRLSPNEKFRILAIIPVITAMLDFTENSMITAMIYNFPNIPEKQASITATLSTAKWSSVFLFEAIVVLFIAIQLIRKIALRKTAS